MLIHKKKGKGSIYTIYVFDFALANMIKANLEQERKAKLQSQDQEPAREKSSLKVHVEYVYMKAIFILVFFL